MVRVAYTPPFRGAVDISCVKLVILVNYKTFLDMLLFNLCEIFAS